MTINTTQLSQHEAAPTLRALNQTSIQILQLKRAINAYREYLLRVVHQAPHGSPLQLKIIEALAPDAETNTDSFLLHTILTSVFTLTHQGLNDNVSKASGEIGSPQQEGVRLQQLEALTTRMKVEKYNIKHLGCSTQMNLISMQILDLVTKFPRNAATNKAFSELVNAYKDRVSTHTTFINQALQLLGQTLENLHSNK